MNTTLTAAAGLLALLLPAVVQAAPKPPAIPARILVTLQAVEVSSRDAKAIAPVPYPAPGAFDALLKEGGEAAEVSVQTPNDFPGVARYSRTFSFMAMDHGKAIRSFLTAPTSLEATPHINADGTITVSLKMEMTRVAPAVVGAVPMTTSQRMTARRTFKSGQTVVLGGTVLAIPGGKPGAPSETKELLQFMTVTVLPSQVAAGPKGL